MRIERTKAVSSTKTSQVGGSETRARGARTARRSEAIDRDALLDRLHQLRTVIPAFAQELADVRRTAAQLRTDNRRLLAEVHRLRRERGESQAKQRLTVG
jgi:phage shock protein A